ncbi:HAMP domain-containing sensor histidine kinase [Solwaraspora sp. WMMD1047]|uniref:HAMP domain-containing sensor histidine kinase n=1 Tax=Solwaraspora sp. WMMD1047 TaxID=3016102 RepID=UPI002415C68B|nr:HAMP domain-containing sensor histidine kinase [Solwaraspora sp. WMMD1047]MDG4834530.1 HAMP domain-containing sensor histidine kinase [Solwaraspora sp. WMMD1047]
MRPDRIGRTLTARAVLVGCAVALVSVLVTASVAVPLAARAAERQAREALAAQARLAAEALRPRFARDRGPDPTVGQDRIIRQLADQSIDAYLIRDGVADRSGLPPGVVDRIAGGRNFSGRRLVRGEVSLVEGRWLPGGNGVVLTRPLATGLWRLVGPSLWVPLLAGLVAGVVAGTLLARRLARPIRTAATVAARLSAGERDVRVPVEPPDEIADLAHAINDLASALATSERRQREFLLSVSHELRTPLTTIRGYAEALADGVVADAGGQRAGQTVLAAAVHLDRLVSDLLALARLDAVDFALEPTRLDLARLVTDAVEAWSGRYAAHGVGLRAELPPAGTAGTPTDRVSAYADAGRIRQVVDGLLENALRVVPPGAPVVVAARPATPAGGIVEVRDGGPGLTDDDLAVAFERGALRDRYAGVRRVGSGLGLALAAGLVRRLGGRIEAGHATEGGARFTVWLPPAPGTTGNDTAGSAGH